MRVTRQPRRFAIGLLLLGLVASACSIDFGDGDGQPDGDGQSETGGPRVEGIDDADIVFGSVDAGVPINPLLFGTNVPAWVNPDRTSQAWFTTAVAESGATLLRFPGGSWSNWYDWRGCLDRSEACFWTWALAPQDYARVIVDTNLPAMWTANINASPQENAALVAFFNGELDDDRPIGIDRNGVDWLTVADWAGRRADYGFAEPVGIQHWELGNEVYGAVESKGPNCAPWGWEDVWTCDGAEYMNGIEGQEGFNAMAAAMRDVDPSIVIGAVGVSPTDSWSDFGTEVLAAGVETIDFYVVHHYAFGGPFDIADVVDSHLELDWTGQVADIDEVALAAGHREAPIIAVTEYNLVAWQDADEQAVMTTMRNLFHLVASLGEMAAAEVDIATQWSLLSGLQESGTDYGVIDGDTQVVYPSFFALRLWSTMGDHLLPVSDHPDLTEYAAAGDDGSNSVLLANPTADSIAVVIAAPADTTVAADVVSADDLESRRVTYNGVPITTIDDVVGIEPLELGTADTSWGYEVPSFSVVLLRFEPAG